MALAINQHIDTPDHNLWLDNLANAHCRLLTALSNSNIVVLNSNTLFEMWDSKIYNCNVVMINYDDIVWDSVWFKDLEKTAKKYNVKFTLITNVVYTKETHCKWYKVLFLKELFGVFYNPHITQEKLNASNLFTCLMQRTTFPRLKLFSELSRNNLLHKGNVSLLGYQTNDLTVSEVINQLNNEFNEFDDILEKHQFPYKNFIEIGNCFDIEKQSKYVVVSETYNDRIVPEWISFTEKTFRSLQIPNISVLLNKKGANDILTSIGIKTHPINHILDYLTTYDAQTDFIIGLLSGDMFDLELADDIAIHNQHQIKDWYDSLQTVDFYNNVVDKVLLSDS